MLDILGSAVTKRRKLNNDGALFSKKVEIKTLESAGKVSVGVKLSTPMAMNKKQKKIDDKSHSCKKSDVYLTPRRSDRKNRV